MRDRPKRLTPSEYRKIAEDLIAAGPPRSALKFACSFCFESIPDDQSEPHTVAGPQVFICHECVARCVEIMGEDPEWREQQIEVLTRLRG